MSSPNDLIDLLGAHAIQLAEWSQDPNNADAAVTLLVMAQHCNEAAAEIERLNGELHAACVVGYTQGAYDYCDSHAQPDALELNAAAVEHADRLFGMTPNTGLSGRGP